MTTLAASALVVGILYFLSRWQLATVDYAAAHPGRGRPAVSWHVAWVIALIVSGMSAASVHVMLMSESGPRQEDAVFNAIVFGGFFVGFLVTGLLDHRLRLREPGRS